MVQPTDAPQLCDSLSNSPRSSLTGDAVDICKLLMAQGLDKKSAMREVAKQFNVSRREIYNALIVDNNEL